MADRTVTLWGFNFGAVGRDAAFRVESSASGTPFATRAHMLVRCCGIPVLVVLFFGTRQLVAQRFDFGTLGGLRVTDDIDSVSGALFSGTGESKRYIVGPTLAIRLPWRFSFEFDALYRREGYTATYSSQYPGLNSLTRDRSNSFEFSMIVKYRFAHSLRHSPFVGVGYAPRIVRGTDVSSGTTPQGLGGAVSYTNQSAPTYYPVTHGLLVSGGFLWDTAHLRIAPELRYVHWNEPFLYVTHPDSPQLVSPQSEVFVLIGLSWHRSQR